MGECEVIEKDQAYITKLLPKILANCLVFCVHHSLVVKIYTHSRVIYTLCGALSESSDLGELSGVEHLNRLATKQFYSR